jgi:uncharacterized protein YoxC
MLMLNLMFDHPVIVAAILLLAIYVSQSLHKIGPTKWAL